MAKTKDVETITLEVPGKAPVELTPEQFDHAVEGLVMEKRLKIAPEQPELIPGARAENEGLIVTAIVKWKTAKRKAKLATKAKDEAEMELIAEIGKANLLPIDGGETTCKVNGYRLTLKPGRDKIRVEDIGSGAESRE